MKDRLIIIDAIRGIAIILMVYFHIFISENLFNNKYYNTSTGRLGFIGHISRTTFLILVGISYMCSLNKIKNNKNRGCVCHIYTWMIF